MLVKGFREKPYGDHDRYWLYIGEQKQAIFTKLSRGRGYRTYGDKLVSEVARHLRLTKSDLRELVSCTIDGVEYLAILRTNGNL